MRLKAAGTVLGMAQSPLTSWLYELAAPCDTPHVPGLTDGQLNICTARHTHSTYREKYGQQKGLLKTKNSSMVIVKHLEAARPLAAIWTSCAAAVVNSAPVSYASACCHHVLVNCMPGKQ